MTTATTTHESSSAIATRPFDPSGIEVAASSRDPREITARIRNAMEHAFFIGPMTQCPTLPEGCEVAFSTVMVDTDLDHKEIYSIGGEYGLHKTVLNKIKMAVGVRWDKAASQRLDNASDPHYCHYKAYGYIRKYDGTEDTIEGDEAIDLRDNSALCQEIKILKIDKALNKLAKELKNRDPNQNEKRAAIDEATKAAEADIRKKRIKILRLAQTSAQNAAIRSMGIRHSYTLEELENKPFVIGTLVYTGRSDDPVIARENAARIADHFLGARSQLYTQPAPAQLSGGHQTYAPPPITSTSISDVANFIDAEDIDDEETNGHGNGGGHHEERQQQAAQTESNTQTADSKSEAADQKTGVPEPTGDFEIRFGRDKGKKVSELSLSKLSSLHTFLTTSIESDDPDRVKYRAQNEGQRSIVDAWIDYRRATGGDKPKQANIF